MFTMIETMSNHARIRMTAFVELAAIGLYLNYVDWVKLAS